MCQESVMQQESRNVMQTLGSRMPMRGFNIASVKKDTYICSLPFVGGKSPTADHPDPIPATASQLQVGYLSS